MTFETPQEEDEISLIDLLLVVAQNSKLLVIGPLLAGLIALGVSYALPQTFVSQAMLLLPASTSTQAAAIMASPIVLDPVIQSLGLARDAPMEKVRNGLAEQVKAVVGKDGLLRLDITGKTPQDAQTLANSIIDAWLKSTLPTEQNRQDLEKRLVVAQNGFKSVTALLDGLVDEGRATLGKPLTRGEAGTSLVAMGELQARYLADVLSIPRALQGLSRDVVIQAPTLPVAPASPKKGLIAIMTALGVGFALLLFVFMRQAWRHSAADPELARKQSRLLSTLGFKPSSNMREQLLKV